jgi:hypothetical protein
LLEDATRPGREAESTETNWRDSAGGALHVHANMTEAEIPTRTVHMAAVFKVREGGEGTRERRFVRLHSGSWRIIRSQLESVSCEKAAFLLVARKAILGGWC